MSAVHIIWKCTKPNSQTLVKFYEQLMTQAAHSKGMDTAVIRQVVFLITMLRVMMAYPDNYRHGIHNTTRVGGRYVKTVPHITGDIVNSKLEADLIPTHCDLKFFCSQEECWLCPTLQR